MGRKYTPRWLNGSPLSSKQKGDAAEKQVRRTFASGAFWHDKGDIETQEFLFDVKATQHRSYSLRIDDWEKIEKEAVGKQKSPGMVIMFEGGPKLVILKMEEWNGIRKAVEGLKEE